MEVYLSILACPINVNFSQGAFVVTSIKAGLGVINFDTHATLLVGSAFFDDNSGVSRLLYL